MHLTAHQVAAYWSGRLAADDLLALDRHIADCAGCRDALLSAAPDSAAFDALESGPILDPAAGHLDDSQIGQYIEGAVPPGSRAALDEHLAGCASCRAEVNDLRQFRAASRAPAAPVKKPPRLFGLSRATMAVAAAALAATICIAVIGLARRRTVPASAEPFAVLLNDGGQAVGLDARGNLRGLANLSDAESAAIAAVLRGSGLPLPAPPSGLTQPAAHLRSAAGPAPEFAATDPLGRVTLEDRPVFRWTALPGASSYRVAILDEDLRAVAQSPALSQPQWQPGQPLPRGRVYTWQVTAVRSGDEVRAPQPPAPEARFAVLDRAQFDRVAAAEARVPVSHLALAVLYAQSGLQPECLRELQTLEAANPTSPLLARLRRQLP